MSHDTVVFRIKEAAERLGLSRQRVHQMLDAGVLPTVLNENGKRCVPDYAIAERLTVHPKSPAPRKRGRLSRIEVAVQGGAQYLHPDEIIARRYTHATTAILVFHGKIVKPETCEICGGIGKSGGIIAHHPDYADPYNVMWLCKKCHANWHARNKPLDALRQSALPKDAK